MIMALANLYYPVSWLFYFAIVKEKKNGFGIISVSFSLGGGYVSHKIANNT